MPDSLRQHAWRDMLSHAMLRLGEAVMGRMAAQTQAAYDKEILDLKISHQTGRIATSHMMSVHSSRKTAVQTMLLAT